LTDRERFHRAVVDLHKVKNSRAFTRELGPDRTQSLNNALTELYFIDNMFAEESLKKMAEKGGAQ
jgi:hypothetical protein